MIDVDGLQSYINGEILTSWEGEVDAEALNATRSALRELASALIAIADAPTMEQIGELFTACVERLNAIDVEHEFICTIEREDLCEELYALGDLSEASENVDDWLDDRDW